MPYQVTFDEFCRLVERAMESFPYKFRPYLDNVAVDVFDEPSDDDRAIRALRNEDAEDETDEEETDGNSSQLLGLFVGVPLTQQSFDDHHANLVKIYRGPLQRVSRNRRALQQNIRATILHEFAHHFGFSEEDLDAFEATQEEWLD